MWDENRLIYTVAKSSNPFLSTWKIISNKIMTPHPQDLPPGSLKNYPFLFLKNYLWWSSQTEANHYNVSTTLHSCLCPWCVAEVQLNEQNQVFGSISCLCHENARPQLPELNTDSRGCLLCIRHFLQVAPSHCLRRRGTWQGLLARQETPPTGNFGLRIPTWPRENTLDCCPPRCSSLKLPSSSLLHSHKLPLCSGSLPIFPYRCFL